MASKARGPRGRGGEVLHSPATDMFNHLFRGVGDNLKLFLHSKRVWVRDRESVRVDCRVKRLRVAEVFKIGLFEFKSCFQAFKFSLSFFKFSDIISPGGV